MSEVPVSFCPFTGGECRRLGCQLWVETGEGACAFWFMGAEALRCLKEGRE